MKTVGIIGGAGFIGSYITQKFLSENFLVKVSVRDISKEEKYQHLMALPYFENLIISELDIFDIQAIEDFISNCNILVHCGTPYQLEVNDPEKDLMEPTIQGTENFLKILKGSTHLEKMVFFASVAAFNTNYPFPLPDKLENDPMDENSEKFMSSESIPYSQAKFIANQTVEKFVLENPDLSVEISSISPATVIGKSLSIRDDSTSMGLQYLIKNKIIPNDLFQHLYDTDVYFALVDVQDVAEATFKLATTKDLHGKNYLISNTSYRISDINRMLNSQEPLENGKLVYRNTLAKSDLGMEFSSVQESLKNYSI